MTEPSEEAIKLYNTAHRAHQEGSYLDAALIIDAALAAAREDERAKVWQPIETAPKDCRRLIAAWRDAEMGAWVISPDTAWHLYHWCSDGDGHIEPTHWMPLPSPPTP